MSHLCEKIDVVFCMKLRDLIFRGLFGTLWTVRIMAIISKAWSKFMIYVSVTCEEALYYVRECETSEISQPILVARTLPSGLVADFIAWRTTLPKSRPALNFSQSLTAISNQVATIRRIFVPRRKKITHENLHLVVQAITLDQAVSKPDTMLFHRMPSCIWEVADILIIHIINNFFRFPIVIWCIDRGVGRPDIVVLKLQEGKYAMAGGFKY